MTHVFVILACGSLTASAHAATLIHWELTDVPVLPITSTAVPILSSYASSDDSQISVSDLDLGSLKWSNGYSGGQDKALNLTNWQNASNLNTPANYMSFTMDVGAYSTVTIDSLALSNYRNGQAPPPTDGTWEYSVNGGTDYIQIGRTSALTNPTSYGITDVLAGQSPLTFNAGESGTVIFRFSATGGTSNTANLHINGITMTGSVTRAAIPEPVTASFLFGGLAAGLFIRRRSR